MRTATFTLFDGPNRVNGILRPGRDERSWDYITGPIGVHSPRLPTTEGECYGLRITSGVLYRDQVNRLVGAGVRFDKIEIDFGVPVSVPNDPRTPFVQADGTKVVIGGQGVRHCIPPRAALRIRVAIGFGKGADVHKLKPVGLRGARIAPGVIAPFPSGLAVPIGDNAAEIAAILRGALDPVGLFAQMGPQDGGSPNGDQLEFLAGVEQNPRVAVLRAAAVMARHQVDCLDARTGDPVPPGRVNSTNYYLDGFWSKTGQLTEFAEYSIADTNRDAPRPRWWNTGACSYENLAAGADAWASAARHNHEHLRRVNAPLEGAVEQWADPISRIDQRNVAGDVVIALSRTLPDLAAAAVDNRGRGDGNLGWRGLSWPCDALLNGPDTTDLGDDVARMIVAVRTDAGTANARRFGYPYNPPAWEKSDAVPDPLPINVSVTQSMEETIGGFVIARAGYVPSARLLFDRMFVSGRTWFGLRRDPCIFERHGFIPKFYGVAVDGKPVRRITQFAGGGDYFQHTAAALGFFLARDRKPFVDALVRMASPYGKSGLTVERTLKNLREDGGKEQTGIAIAALERAA